MTEEYKQFLKLVGSLNINEATKWGLVHTYNDDSKHA